LKGLEKKTRYLVLGLLFLTFIAAAQLNGKEQQDQALRVPQSQIAITPTCLDRSDIPDSEYHWLYFPTSPSELATQEYYGFLGGQLIRNGVVDASDCPADGLYPNGYANACGMEAGQDIIFELQNVYDDEIVQVGRDIGTPPVMLKQLIRYESQFWPIRYSTYHYGLGHLTLIGAANAIQWSPELYDDLCTQVYNGPCPQSYNQSYLGFDNLLSGQLLSLMDAGCPDCEYKIDIARAENSIQYVGQALMSVCKQTSQIVYNVTGEHSSATVDYATIWKLTLVNYNAGPQCVFDALDAAYTPTTTKLTWASISANFTSPGCKEGLSYTNNITAKYYSFTPPN
jgi:hypothetical protein